MSQSEPRRCRTASSNWLRIMRNQVNLSGFEERLRGATILTLSAVSIQGARDAESAITAAMLLRFALIPARDFNASGIMAARSYRRLKRYSNSAR